MGPMGSRPGRRTVSTLLWIAVVVGGLALSAQRLLDVLSGDNSIDLAMFLDAARHAASGESVYLGEGYVYLPFVAWVLVPFSHLPVDAIIGPWTVASLLACWGAIAAVVATLWPVLSWWQRPVVAGVALVTLLYNNITTMELWLGQSDTFVLLLTALAALASSLRWPAVSGVMIGIAALVKTWPVGFGLWLLRSGAPHKWRSVVAAVATGAIGVAIVAIVSGPTTVGDWVERTVAFSEQELIAFSVWGVGKHLFTDSGVMPSLVVAPIWGAVISWLLAAGVVVLVVVSVLRPGTDSLAMWNITSAIVLLLPVSHQWYKLLMLPLVWVWVAYALERRRDLLTVVTAVASVGFWVVIFRLPPLDNLYTEDVGQYALVMGTAILMLTLSVLTAARRASVAAEHRPTPSIRPGE